MRRRSKNKHRRYWDTSCFIALLNRNPAGDPIRLQALQQVYEDMLSGKVEVVSCGVLVAEMIHPESKQFLQELRKLKQFELIETTISVHELAAELRSRCQNWRQGTERIHVPKVADATHLAAAILSKCDEFWTLDEKLLRLDRIIEEIHICLPHIEQIGLPLNDPE